MKLNIHSVGFDARDGLLEFIQARLDKLETFYGDIIDGEVFLRVEPGDANENKLVEVKLNLPGSSVFAKSQSKSFEAATDETAEALRRQIKKFKEKIVLKQ
ncbi:MAG: ribosome-associated translation inhibitor RaiA [Bernardetiaceae bacterium]|nr:ribosome-associated translation inhibitor RaiA [Bernardetiaceae bacterium]